jgi:hypothetical protein
MAKKSRRAKRRAKQRRSGAVPPVSAAAAVAAAATREKTARAEARAAEVTEHKAEVLTEEYRYVYSDLRRIAILAAAMLAALVVLSFVIG